MSGGLVVSGVYFDLYAFGLAAITGGVMWLAMWFAGRDPHWHTEHYDEALTEREQVVRFVNAPIDWKYLPDWVD